MRILALITIMLTSGCARFSTVQTDTSYDEAGNIQRQIKTRATAYTFVAGRSALANWKATQDDSSQGASVGSLQQESDAGPIVGAAVDAAVKAAIGKP